MQNKTHEHDHNTRVPACSYMYTHRKNQTLLHPKDTTYFLIYTSLDAEVNISNYVSNQI